MVPLRSKPGLSFGFLMTSAALVKSNAREVEAAFAARPGESAAVSEPEKRMANGHRRRPQKSEPASNEVTVIGKPVRERDRDHLRFVAAQPSLVCGRTPSDPHHTADNGAQGQ
jgi:hypothetical protein